MYALGGVVTGEVLVALEDDECVWSRERECVRDDDRHNFEMIEAPRRLVDRNPEYVRGYCFHRPCHVVSVESGGELVARLCRACDGQLPA